MAELLIGAGERVVGVDNFDPMYDVGLKRRALAEVEATGAKAGPGVFEFAELDLTNMAALRGLFERVKPAGVIHLAARAGVRPSIQDPAGYMHMNVTGTASVLEAARVVREDGCDRVVVASSSSVYGNGATVPFVEDADVDRPISPYAASKRACEILAWTHHNLTGVPVACLRFFTVFGPRQRPDLAINSFLRRTHSGEAITLFGDGSTSRDYTYIDDIAMGVWMAYKRIPRYGYRIWNLGGSSPVSLGDLLSTIERVVGKEANVRRGPDQPGDVQRTWADLKRAYAELNYEPRTGLEEGIRRQWAWMQGAG